MWPKDIHHCTLEKRSIDQLFPLPPNASIFARLWRAFRELCVLNTRCVRSKAFFRNKSTMMHELKRHAKGYWFIIHPFSIMIGFIDAIFTIAWVSQILIIPIRFSFTSEIPRWVSKMSWLVSWCQSVVFVMFFVIGYVKYTKKEIVIDPVKIVYHYLATYCAFDFFSAWGVYIFDTFVNFDKSLDQNHMYYFLAHAFILACHLVRTKTILNNIQDFFAMLKLHNAIYATFSHALIILSMLNIMTTYAYRIPSIIYEMDYPPESWLRQADIHNRSLHQYYEIYCECLLNVICYFFGASYGAYDVTVANEQITMSIIGITGRLYTLYFLADLLKMFGLVGIAESRYEQYLSQLEEYMNSKHLPDRLRERLLTYYEYTLRKQYFNETQIIDTLSDHLKTELFLYGARKLIERAKVLRQLPRSILGSLFSHMTIETFLVNDVIIRIGSPVENVYFVSSGTVAVLNEEGFEICHLEDGEEFGFVSMMEGHEFNKYKHIAAETTEVYFMPAKAMLEFLHSHPEITRYFEYRCKSKLASYAKVENVHRQGGEDFLSHLREGTILEVPHIRARRVEM